MLNRRDPDRRAFLTTAGIGTAALLGGARSASAAEWNAAERANVQTVTEFCPAWATRDMTRGLPCLADDCVYRMTETTPPANGPDGIIQRLKPTIDNATLVEFRVLDTMAAGPIVINH